MHFHSRKFFRKWRLENDGHFVSASLCKLSGTALTNVRLWVAPSMYTLGSGLPWLELVPAANTGTHSDPILAHSGIFKVLYPHRWFRTLENYSVTGNINSCLVIFQTADKARCLADLNSLGMRWSVQGWKMQTSCLAKKTNYVSACATCNLAGIPAGYNDLVGNCNAWCMCFMEKLTRIPRSGVLCYAYDNSSFITYFIIYHSSIPFICSYRGVFLITLLCFFSCQCAVPSILWNICEAVNSFPQDDAYNR